MEIVGQKIDKTKDNKQKRRKILKGLGYALLVFIILAMAWTFDFDGFAASLRSVHPLAFLALIGLQIISQLLINYQWCHLGRVMDKDSSFWRMLYVNSAGNLIDGITPGVKVGGEVARALSLKSLMNYSTAESATLVTLQKIISFFSFFLVNLLAFAHLSRQFELFQSLFLQLIVYGFLIALVVFLLSFFVMTSRMRLWLGRLGPRKQWQQSLQGYAITVLDNIVILKSIPWEVAKQFILSLAIWLLFPLKMIILVALFTPLYDPVFLTEVTFISYMMGMIPLLPGGLGSFEATMTSLLLMMDLQAGQALAITLVFRFITFWLVIIVSMAYLGLWKIIKKTNYKEGI